MTDTNVQLVDQQTINVQAQTHKGAGVIAFYNPENAAPYLSITEVTRGLPEGMPDTPRTYNLHDMSVNIPMLNPVTGASTGVTMGFNEIYAILFSLYMYARTHCEPH